MSDIVQMYNEAEKHLRDVGLPDLVAGASYEAWGKDSPSGKPGMLYRWKHESAEGLVIKWVPARALLGLPQKRYWLGYWPDDRPEPTDLRKKHGYALENGYIRHGLTWWIPQATEAPADLIWNEDGTISEEVAEEYREFWDRSLKWKIELIEQDALDPVGIARWLKSKGGDYWLPAWYCFREVYRMPPELLFELRVLGRTDWTFPVSVAIGNLLTEDVLRAIDEALQKKAAVSTTGSGAGTSPGDAASASEPPVTPITTS